MRMSMAAAALACTVVIPVQADARQRTIIGQDEDVVLLSADATITVVRSLQGRLRVSAHEDGRQLVVLLDEGPHPDGTIDWAYRLELEAPFPRAYLWEGAGTLEEYERLGFRRGGRAFGVVTHEGRIFFSGGPVEGGVPVPQAIATFAYTGHSSRKVRGTIAQAEQQILEMGSGRGPRMDAGVVPSPGPSAGVLLVPGGAPGPQPRKVRHVDPVLPEAARQAGVRGAVLVEITVDAQGAVTDARVLRSIPMLDDAALVAVRQWVFTPAIVNGVPQPVTMTVPVLFGP